jgi:ribosomal protein S18 acetylase RimI-like enzyme
VEVKMRRARPEELEAIKALSVRETVLELDEYELQEKERVEKEDFQRLEAFFKKEGNEFYVAESDGGEMAGYLWWGISQRPFSDIKIGWVYDIQVLPQFRGKGVGEVMIRHALKLSKEKGYYQTGLMVNEKNGIALALYEKLGFRTEHRIMARNEPDAVSPLK